MLNKRKADLQTINALRDSIEQEILSADKKQDLSATSKAESVSEREGKIDEREGKNITGSWSCTG